jgi:biopolymer transport protein ExbD
MSDQPKRFFDLWFVQANNVIKEVPFHVVTDWIQQGRAVVEDRIKPSGTADWYSLGDVIAFQPYFPAPEPEPHRPADAAEAMAPVEMDFDWKPGEGDGDEDVDMIPLIDISLVLLIFFMMTMTVAAISRISVPDMGNATKIESDPGIVRIDIDLRDGRIVYSVATGTNNPAPEDDNLGSDVELKQRLDEKLKTLTSPPKVRIAAHGDLTYELVEEVLKALEQRVEKGQIREYAVEVNERPKP